MLLLLLWPGSSLQSRYCRAEYIHHADIGSHVLTVSRCVTHSCLGSDLLFTPNKQQPLMRKGLFFSSSSLLHSHLWVTVQGTMDFNETKRFSKLYKTSCHILISQKILWRSHIQTLVPVLWLFWVEDAIVGTVVLAVTRYPLHPYCLSKAWKTTAEKCQHDDCQRHVKAEYWVNNIIIAGWTD